MAGIKIIGLGKSQGDTVVTNDDLAKIVETSDQWIREKSGIRSRFFARKKSNADMAAEAAEKAIENFILSMQKNDLSSMMIYTDLYGEEDPLSQDLAEILIRQGKVAEQIQTFYYYLMGNEFAATENVSLDELGMTGEEISSSLELSEIVYLDLNNVLKIKDDEYAAFYYFNGKHYMSGFNMKEYGQGWKIEELPWAWIRDR